jgi:hypothetical protein
MKDLKFTGTIGSTNVNISYRTDLIHPDATNFTVSQIQVSDSFSPNDERDVEHESIFNEFKRLPYNLQFFIQFAQEKGLKLTMSNSDGSDEVVLVEEDESGS